MAAAGQHMTVACRQCGALYRQSRSDQMYCSPRCGLRGWAAEHKPVRPQCAVCKREIGKGRKKYCSDDCSEQAERERKHEGRGARGDARRGKQFVARQSCEVCGTPFYAPPCMIIRNRGRFCSPACKGVFMSRHPETLPQTKGRRGNGGRRSDLADRYFRSSWEANYARYLEWLVRQGEIVSWEYEVDSFEFPVKRGTRTYLPDFKVWVSPEKFEYHEVKGYMDQRSATKLKRMKRYYPAVKVVLIDAAAYRSIAAGVWRLIPGWEQRRQGGLP